MTAPDLQREIARERIEREATHRQRQLARLVLEGGGRVAVITGFDLRAAIWPTRMKAARDGLPDSSPLAISWVQWAVAQGWLSDTGHREAGLDGRTWAALVLTPKGRRFAEESGPLDLVAPLPGSRDPPRTFRDGIRDLFRPKR